MNVQEMLAFMATEGQTGDEPTAEEQVIFTRWLNVANDELFRKFNQFIRGQIEETALVTTDANGRATLPTNYFSMVQVADVSNKVILTPKDIVNIEKENPALDDQGAPEHYYINGRIYINVYPFKQVTLRVRFNPKRAILTNTSDEASILWPAPYHNVLVDGALYYLFKSESTLRSQFDIEQAAARYASGTAELLTFLMSNAIEPQRTEAQDF